jgi:hypothetical protein
LNLEPLTSGDSNFESATGSPALEPTEQGKSLQPPIDELIEGGPQVETEQTRTKQIELIEEGPQIDFKEKHDPLVKSSYFTKP